MGELAQKANSEQTGEVMKAIENMNPSELAKLREDATKALFSGLEDHLKQMAGERDLREETGDKHSIQMAVEETIHTWDMWGEPGWYRFYYTDGEKTHPIMWTGIETIEHMAEAFLVACSYAHSELGVDCASASWNVFCSLDHAAKDWK